MLAVAMHVIEIEKWEIIAFPATACKLLPLCVFACHPCLSKHVTLYKSANMADMIRMKDAG